MSNDVLAAARRAYDIATASWNEQRRIGGIARLDRDIPEDSDELSKGARYKCTTPAAAMVMGVWEKCKAELDAAAANRRRDLGDESCPTCPEKDSLARTAERIMALAEPDKRLPPEHDDEAPQP